jgi:hypothetical protein
MAFTITVGTGITEETAGTKYSMRTSGNDEVILVVDYTKGDETTVDFTFGLNFPTFSNLEVQYQERNTSDIMENMTIKLNATGKTSIPLPVPKCTDKLYIYPTNAGGTPTGSFTLYGIDDSEIG